MGHAVKMTPQNRTIFFGMDQGSAELNSSNIKGKNPFADKRVRLAMYHALRYGRYQRQGHERTKCPSRYYYCSWC